MANFPDSEESSPIPLVRRLSPARGVALGSMVEVTDEDDERSHWSDRSTAANDRMSPAASGGIAGLFAGAAALGAVHLLAPQALARPLIAVAEARGVDLAASF